MSLVDKYLGEPELYQLANEDLPKIAICHGIINSIWLQQASPEEQLRTICKWFVSRYADPANVLPYNSREGGYIWIDGGPYDARDEVEFNFTDIVPNSVLEQAIEIIENSGIYDWCKAEPFDDDYGLCINNANESLQETQESIHRLIALLGKDNPTLNQLLFASMISILETYLWRTMSFVCSHPGMSEKILKVFDKTQANNQTDCVDARKKAEKILADVLWQHNARVANIFNGVLSIKVDLSCFDHEKLMRHNIVHRFGRDKSGMKIYISENDVKELSNKVSFFCKDLHNRVIALLHKELKDNPHSPNNSIQTDTNQSSL